MERDAPPTPGTFDARGDHVLLVVPPSSGYLRTARLVAADAAVRAGCDVGEVEDFRIAIDELCHLLMSSTDHLVHLTITTTDAGVVARGAARVRTLNATHELDGVSAMIVQATTDRFEIVIEGNELVFEVVKRARRPARADEPSDVVSPR